MSLSGRVRLSFSERHKHSISSWSTLHLIIAWLYDGTGLNQCEMTRFLKLICMAERQAPCFTRCLRHMMSARDVLVQVCSPLLLWSSHDACSISGVKMSIKLNCFQDLVCTRDHVQGHSLALQSILNCTNRIVVGPQWRS